VGDLIGDLYDLIGRQGLSGLPDLLAPMAGARSCAFQVKEPDLRPRVLHTSYFPDQMNIAYVENAIFLDDRWGLCADRHAHQRGAIRVSEMVGQDAYHRSRFYQDFIREFGDDTGRCMGLSLVTPQGAKVQVGFHRAFGSEDFDDIHLANVNDLQGHVARLVDLEFHLASIERTNRSLLETFLALPFAVAIVDDARRVLIASRQAETIFGKNTGIRHVHGKVILDHPSDRARFDNLLQSALSRTGSCGGAMRTAQDDGGDSHQLIVMPFENDGATAALVCIVNAQTNVKGAGGYLRQMFDLTTAEAEVALLLADGLGVQAIGEMRGVSENTVKTLVQRVYRKCDTNRATHIARIVSRLPSAPSDSSGQPENRQD
jgi:DNA-binding CsgD family transcriptional regulator